MPLVSVTGRKSLVSRPGFKGDLRDSYRSVNIRDFAYVHDFGDFLLLLFFVIFCLSGDFYVVIPLGSRACGSFFRHWIFRLFPLYWLLSIQEWREARVW